MSCLQTIYVSLQELSWSWLGSVVVVVLGFRASVSLSLISLSLWPSCCWRSQLELWATSSDRQSRKLFIKNWSMASNSDTMSTTQTACRQLGIKFRGHSIVVELIAIKTGITSLRGLKKNGFLRHAVHPNTCWISLRLPKQQRKLPQFVVGILTRNLRCTKVMGASRRSVTLFWSIFTSWDWLALSLPSSSSFLSSVLSLSSVPWTTEPTVQGRDLQDRLTIVFQLYNRQKSSAYLQGSSSIDCNISREGLRDLLSV